MTDGYNQRSHKLVRKKKIIICNMYLHNNRCSFLQRNQVAVAVKESADPQLSRHAFFFYGGNIFCAMELCLQKKEKDGRVAHRSI